MATKIGPQRTNRGILAQNLLLGECRCITKWHPIENMHLAAWDSERLPSRFIPRKETGDEGDIKETGTRDNLLSVHAWRNCFSQSSRTKIPGSLFLEAKKTFGPQIIFPDLKFWTWEREYWTYSPIWDNKSYSQYDCDKFRCELFFAILCGVSTEEPIIRR